MSEPVARLEVLLSTMSPVLNGSAAPSVLNGSAGRLPLLQAITERRTETRVRHEPVVFKPPVGRIDCCGWMQSVFSCRGRPLKPVLAPTVLVVLISAACSVATQTDYLDAYIGENFDANVFFEYPDRLTTGYSGLFVSLSFLLVFRLNRTAQRFYEARTAAGVMVVACRELASEAVIALAHDLRARDELCRWTIAFPVAVRNYLREEKGMEFVAELAGVLSDVDLKELGSARRQPCLVVDRIRSAALDGIRSNRGDSMHIAASQLSHLNRETELLQIGMGSMERINNTPLPFAYVSHLRQFLVAYLVFMPVVFAKSWGWASPIAMTVLCFGLIGIEAVSINCERPFGYGSNHLDMNRFCDVIAEDVSQSLTHCRNRRSGDTTGEKAPELRLPDECRFPIGVDAPFEDFKEKNSTHGTEYSFGPVILPYPNLEDSFCAPEPESELNAGVSI